MTKLKTKFFFIAVLASLVVACVAQLKPKWTVDFEGDISVRSGSIYVDGNSNIAHSTFDSEGVVTLRHYNSDGLLLDEDSIDGFIGLRSIYTLDDAFLYVMAESDVPGIRLVKINNELQQEWELFEFQPVENNQTATYIYQTMRTNKEGSLIAVAAKKVEGDQDSLAVNLISSNGVHIAEQTIPLLPDSEMEIRNIGFLENGIVVRYSETSYAAIQNVVVYDLSLNIVSELNLPITTVANGEALYVIEREVDNNTLIKYNTEGSELWRVLLDKHLTFLRVTDNYVFVAGSDSGEDVKDAQLTLNAYNPEGELQWSYSNEYTINTVFVGVPYLDLYVSDITELADGHVVLSFSRNEHHIGFEELRIRGLRHEYIDATGKLAKTISEPVYTAWDICFIGIPKICNLDREEEGHHSSYITPFDSDSVLLLSKVKGSEAEYKTTLSLY